MCVYWLRAIYGREARHSSRLSFPQMSPPRINSTRRKHPASPVRCRGRAVAETDWFFSSSCAYACPSFTPSPTLPQGTLSTKLTAFSTTRSARGGAPSSRRGRREVKRNDKHPKIPGFVSYYKPSSPSQSHSALGTHNVYLLDQRPSSALDPIGF